MVDRGVTLHEALDDLVLDGNHGLGVVVVAGGGVARHNLARILPVA